MPGFSKPALHLTVLLAAGTLLGASVVAATERLIPFPTAPAELGGHCMAVGATAEASGAHFKNSTRAGPTLAAGTALKARVLESGAMPRAELERIASDDSVLQEQVNTFIERIGQPERGQFHSDRVFDELDKHLADCNAWLANQEPVLPALPAQATELLEHCVVIAATAQGLSQYPLAAASRGQAARVARNAREFMVELTGSGRFKPDKARFAAPSGDLYLAGADIVLGLKMIRTQESSSTPIEPRSIALIDERLRQCHRKIGMQMPLQ